MSHAVSACVEVCLPQLSLIFHTPVWRVRVRFVVNSTQTPCLPLLWVFKHTTCLRVYSLCYGQVWSWCLQPYRSCLCSELSDFHQYIHYTVSTLRNRSTRWWTVQYSLGLSLSLLDSLSAAGSYTVRSDSGGITLWQESCAFEAESVTRHAARRNYRPSDKQELWSSSRACSLQEIKSRCRFLQSPYPLSSAARSLNE